MNSQIIVGDSSPLISRALVGQLDLPPKLHRMAGLIGPSVTVLRENGIYIRQELVDAVSRDLGESAKA